jgi:hypothetical protein
MVMVRCMAFLEFQRCSPRVRLRRELCLAQFQSASGCAVRRKSVRSVATVNEMRGEPFKSFGILPSGPINAAGRAGYCGVLIGAPGAIIENLHRNLGMGQ